MKKFKSYVTFTAVMVSLAFVYYMSGNHYKIEVEKNV